MLYKVTPALVEEPPKPKVVREPGQPRKRRKTAIYDADGNEVLITLMCLKCKKMRPLMQFGLRKMADGAIRNQPWCRTCRSGAGTPKAKKAALVAGEVARPEVAEAEGAHEPLDEAPEAEAHAEIAASADVPVLSAEPVTQVPGAAEAPPAASTPPGEPAPSNGV